MPISGHILPILLGHPYPPNLFTFISPTFNVFRPFQLAVSCLLATYLLLCQQFVSYPHITYFFPIILGPIVPTFYLFTSMPLGRVLWSDGSLQLSFGFRLYKTKETLLSLYVERVGPLQSMQVIHWTYSLQLGRYSKTSVHKHPRIGACIFNQPEKVLTYHAR